MNPSSSQTMRQEAVEAGAFVQALRDATPGGVLDSAVTDEFLSESAHGRNVKIPDKLQCVIDESGAHGGAVTRAILDSVALYEQSHGCQVPADVIEQAIHNAYGTTDEARRKYSLDSASSNHHDQWSLQPNRAVVAIVSTLGEAIPVAHYLPADIGSNQAKLAVLTHQAGSAHGQYSVGGLMDGAYSGDRYVSSARMNTLTISTAVGHEGEMTGNLTAIQTSALVCDQSGATIPLLRGRSVLYINGHIAARETVTTGSGASAVSGQITISGTTYTIGGTINTDTGVTALTSIPALPNTNVAVMKGFIDYERAPELTPKIITNVEVFDLYAAPWRANTRQSIDSRTQMANELNLDPYSESVLTIQNQFANERHYDVLTHAKLLAANSSADFDFDWSDRNVQLLKGQIMIDLAATIAGLSQQMTINTLGFGITHLYVGLKMAALIRSLGRDWFEPSPVQERAGIYRMGRLFGRYEAYYAPKVITESSHASQILCIGRAPDVARNPFVLGDAVPPTVIPLAVGDDLKTGAGFYARNFTEVNPFAPSASGCALVNCTNLPE